MTETQTQSSKLKFQEMEKKKKIVGISKFFLLLLFILYKI